MFFVLISTFLKLKIPQSGRVEIVHIFHWPEDSVAIYESVSVKILYIYVRKEKKKDAEWVQLATRQIISQF